MTRTTIWTLTLSLALTTAAFAATDEEKCQQALSTAAGNYQLCMNKVFRKVYGGRVFFITLNEKSGKCVDKYAQTWAKLVKKFAGKGTSCEGARYVDNGDGTFYDGLTRLTWEEKTDDGSIHDKDNGYAWSPGSPWKEDGPAFTTFLKDLNDGAFGGSSGWRVPSVYELCTLVEPANPNCTASPCTTAPGETVQSLYWSSSTSPFGPGFAWGVNFSNGLVNYANKGNGKYVRAVRGGS